MAGTTDERTKSTDEIVDRLSGEIERKAFRQRVEVFVASRSAGSAIVADAFNGGAGLDNIIEAAAALAKYADEAIQIVREEFHPALDCQVGCCYCCCKPGVLVSIPELLRILRHVRERFDQAETSALAERAQRYVEQLNGRDFNQSFEDSFPCPLLVDERCSVYEVRPLVCRGYNSVNVQGCREAYANTTASVPMFALLKDATDGATVGAAQSLREAALDDALVDLGTALAAALTGGAGHEQDVFDGVKSLEQARNPTWLGDLWDAVRAAGQRLGLDIE